MKVLGVQCTNKFAFLSIVEDGAVIEIDPPRLGAAQSTDEDHALWETLGDFERLLGSLKPECVKLLLPGTGDYSAQPHSQLAPRVELETLLRMAAAKRNVPIERLSRAAVRSRLGLPKKGKFETVTAAHIEESGPYWMAGRLAATAVALAASS